MSEAAYERYKDRYKQYFGNYTFEKISPFLYPFKDLIVKVIAPKMDVKIKVLDVGCAKGFLVKMLRENGFDSYGIDISEYALGSAPEDVKSYLFKVDLEQDAIPFPDEFFEVVTSLSTFEHISNVEATLSEVYRVLRSGGYLIVNVPNPRIRSERLKPEHVTMLNKKEWVEMITRYGYKYEETLSEQFEKERTGAFVHLSLAQLPFRRIAVFITKTCLNEIILFAHFKRIILPHSFTLVFKKPEIKGLPR